MSLKLQRNLRYVMYRICLCRDFCFVSYYSERLVRLLCAPSRLMQLPQCSPEALAAVPWVAGCWGVLNKELIAEATRLLTQRGAMSVSGGSTTSAVSGEGRGEEAHKIRVGLMQPVPFDVRVAQEGDFDSDVSRPWGGASE